MEHNVLYTTKDSFDFIFRRLEQLYDEHQMLLIRIAELEKKYENSGNN